MKKAAVKFTAVEQHLVDGGVRNLREFGYPDCTAENILTDRIYRAFFASMLKDNEGRDAQADKAIRSLLERIPKP